MFPLMVFLEFKCFQFTRNCLKPPQ